MTVVVLEVEVTVKVVMVVQVVVELVELVAPGVRRHPDEELE